MNWKGTKKIQLQLFENAVTLNQGKGHWKWNEQVQLDEKYHHENFDIHHIYSVRENPNVKVFDMLRHLTYKEHPHYIP